ICVRCDARDAVEAVLPHEVAHVVLAGQFAAHGVPRWVDEGVAVLTEPRAQVERHFRDLPRLRRGGQLVRATQLLNLKDSPERRYYGSFYAQSVSLVDLLVQEKGPLTFTRFVRDGQRDGYGPALRRHYGWDLSELERRWQRHVFGTPAAPGLAGGGR